MCAKPASLSLFRWTLGDDLRPSYETRDDVRKPILEANIIAIAISVIEIVKMVDDEGDSNDDASCERNDKGNDDDDDEDHRHHHTADVLLGLFVRKTMDSADEDGRPITIVYLI